MQCSCERRDNAGALPPAPTTPVPTRRSTPTRPYDQIVFDSVGPNARFEWISSTSTPTTTTRTRVRSHVMQRFRAQQALSASSSSSGVFEDHDPRIEYYFKCRTCGRLNSECCKDTTTESHAENHIREIMLRILPIDSTPESTRLYEYLSQIYVFIQNPVRRTGLGLVQYCLPFIISSAAVLNSLLSLVASHRILICRHNPDLVAAYYHHKVQAIQIVNQGLSRRSNAVAYDIQVAIAVLAMIEYTTGAVDIARKHIAGLREIISAHGGTLGAPADHYLSLGIVKLANLLVSNDEYDYSSNDDSRRSLERILTALPPDSHPSIKSMFHSLKHLSTNMPRPSNNTNDAVNNTNAIQQSSWLDELNLTELKIHRIIENKLGPLPTSSAAAPFVSSRAYSIAGSIFLCLWLRQLSIRSNVLDYLVDSLVCAFEEEETEDQNRYYPSTILLWLLFVGGAAAEGRPGHRQWILERLSRLVRELDLESWESVKGLLTAFPYVEECDEYYRRIWEDIEKENFD